MGREVGQTGWNADSRKTKNGKEAQVERSESELRFQSMFRPTAPLEFTVSRLKSDGLERTSVLPNQDVLCTKGRIFANGENSLFFETPIQQVEVKTAVQWYGCGEVKDASSGHSRT